MYSAQVEEESFTEALLDAGAHFFGEMRRIVSGQSQDYSRELERIESLRAHAPRNG
ncbi:hypothetical protein F4561_000175 [Lipingzhangella halophila]|uniref:Uncharacterized protein n=1 Tax=Lipingzhangella halophila TaxID=1783352 RepID=A0A7W7W157_9ACTN|nr:hypothetical protein [Lipingzhangella halophila]MBB4929355.1 hypothetical protein [Lipingzhangella halophila]